MDSKQEEFLYQVIADLEDIKLDVDLDLGTDSVPFQKIKDLIETIEDYRNSFE